jgi:hypothetical protein
MIYYLTRPSPFIRVNVVAIGVLLIGLASALSAQAQGVCVIDEIKVPVIKGRVKLPNDLPVRGATLELHEKRDDEPIVSTVMASQDGYFVFDNVKKGKYFIVASAPRLVPLYVPVKVTNQSKGKDKKHIVITLNFLVTKPCGGGDAELQKIGTE